MQKSNKNFGTWIVVIAIIMIVYSLLVNMTGRAILVSYSEFVKLIKEESITKIDLCENEVTAELKEGVLIDSEYTKNIAAKIASDDNVVLSVIDNKKDITKPPF